MALSLSLSINKLCSRFMYTVIYSKSTCLPSCEYAGFLPLRGEYILIHELLVHEQREIFTLSRSLSPEDERLRVSSLLNCTASFSFPRRAFAF